MQSGATETLLLYYLMMKSSNHPTPWLLSSQLWQQQPIMGISVLFPPLTVCVQQFKESFACLQQNLKLTKMVNTLSRRKLVMGMCQNFFAPPFLWRLPSEKSPHPPTPASAWRGGAAQFSTGGGKWENKWISRSCHIIKAVWGDLSKKKVHSNNYVVNVWV